MYSMQRNWKQILLSVDCHNRVRPDLPNKQEQIQIQYTAVERLFYLHIISS